MHRLLGAAVSLILSASLAIPGILFPFQAEGPAQLSADEILGLVDGDRIMATIADLQAFGTRAFYLNQSDDTALYIHDRLQELELEVKYQEFMAGIHPSKNVVATKPGSSSPETLFLFGAHYDSENMLATSIEEALDAPAPGADDDASGVAVTIEIATVLNELRLDNTVRFVAFGAEELGYDESGGLRGSTYYVDAEKSREATYGGTAILDMIGYRGNSVNHATIGVDRANELANATLEAADSHQLDLTLSVVVDPSISYSDHYPFWKAGYPSMLVCEAAPDSELDYQFNPTYHTRDDTIEYLSKEQMTELTKALVGGMLALNGLASEEDDVRTVLLLVLLVAGVIVAVAVILHIARVTR